MEFRKALEKGAKILEKELIKELAAQGHNNTGALASSFTHMFGFEGNSSVIEGYANDYAQILDEGYGSSSVSWKQLPFLIEYFQSKGLPAKEAKQAAAATIVVWKRDGVPSKRSARFSRTGNRTNFIETVEKAFISIVDNAILSEIDKEVDKVFHKTKSETI